MQNKRKKIIVDVYIVYNCREMHLYEIEAVYLHNWFHIHNAADVNVGVLLSEQTLYIGF